MKPYRVLLYYCYTPLADPEAFREEHHLLCLQLNLLGRIIVAPEGLNGTVSGLTADCEAYMAAVKADPRFDSLEFKVEEQETHTFQKLHVRVVSAQALSEDQTGRMGEALARRFKCAIELETEIDPQVLGVP